MVFEIGNIISVYRKSDGYSSDCLLAQVGRHKIQLIALNGNRVDDKIVCVENINAINLSELSQILPDAVFKLVAKDWRAYCSGLFTEQQRELESLKKKLNDAHLDWTWHQREIYDLKAGLGRLNNKLVLNKRLIDRLQAENNDFSTAPVKDVHITITVVPSKNNFAIATGD